MYAVGIRVAGFVACMALFILRTQAQDAAGDTTWLQPVEIVGSGIDTYAAGSHTARLDSLQLALFTSSSLSGLLQSDQGIYLKEYGPGMLSSISLRGTAAHHTSLLWNGLPVNYPSLGVADYSLIPVFFVDKAELVYGGVSALAGSGAIGGAISLDDVLAENQRSIELVQEAGSFGTYFSGVKARISGEKAGGALAAFRKVSKNDYTFINRAKAGSPEERQLHGRYQGNGGKASVFVKPWRAGVFHANGWYTAFQREIIPPYTVPSMQDEQLDKSLRLSLEYRHQLSKGWQLSAQAGRIYDQIRFNGLESATTQRMMSGSAEGNIFPWLQTRIGGLINSIRADVPEYGNEAAELRADFYSYLNFFPSGNWQISINARQALVEAFFVPFTPMLNVSYSVQPEKSKEIKWRSQLSRSYRVPTLNDRFWQPGGKPGLKPEQGWSLESGFDLKAGDEAVIWSASATGYAHWVTDWIIWLPQGNIWTPGNLRNVFSRGAEVSLSHELKAGDMLFSNAFNYSLTLSEIQAAYAGDEANQGNQLPYQPRHQASWNSRLQTGKWRFGAVVVFSGKRFTLVDNYRVLPAYALLDLHAGRSFDFGRSVFDLQLSTKNALDTSYENLEYRPMPGRSLYVRVNYTFKSK